MAYEPVVDLDKLLAPIPGDNPSGSNLIYEGLHDQMREARRADDLLAQGEWKHEPKTANWHEVMRLGTEALSARTKDLQVAAWLTEALVNLHGFAGLHDGLKLMHDLVASFWDTLFPEIDEGDMEARANAIDTLNRPPFLATVQKIPLTNRTAGFTYSFADWKDSTKFVIPDNLDQLPYEEREKVLQRKQTAEDEKKTTSVQWRTGQNASNRAFYEDLFNIVNMCGSECKALDDVMDQKFQRQTPGLSDFKKALEEIRSLVEKIVKEKRVLEPDAAPSEGEGAGESVAAAGAAGLPGGPMRSRQEALRQLAAVAEYFRVTEPHSPVSYLLHRCITWGNMTLEAWLDDVIKDAAVLSHLRETLGIRPKEGP